MKLPFQDADPAHKDFQYLEDLSTAYWYSEILFAALDLKLFELLDQGISTLDDLVRVACCNESELYRILRVLESLNLVHAINDGSVSASLSDAKNTGTEAGATEERAGARKAGIPRQEPGNEKRSNGSVPASLPGAVKDIESLGLVNGANTAWCNSQVARLYLVPGSRSYIGDFLLYRRYMRPKWQEFGQRVSEPRREPDHGRFAEQDYETRTFHYVRAMDQLVRQKALEIEILLVHESWEPPILDVGGGAGALSRSLIRLKDHGCATLVELPEVIRAAQTLYPDKASWERFSIVEGDFRTIEFGRHDQFGLIVLSNFLHAYCAGEARELLEKALDLLAPNGLVLIHDYFPDRKGRCPQKGVLYDLNMMLNTYDGACHDSAEVVSWLHDMGMGRVRVRDLVTDSSIILASGEKSEHDDMGLEQWVYEAQSVGLRRAVLVPVKEMVTASWVRLKCKCGCPVYGRNLQCPPHGMEAEATKEMLGSYTWGLLVEGSPPGRDFHGRLLQLERKAFLAGFHKAFAFSAGPCPVCRACPEDGVCRRPDQARPSMEGSGIDVYTTARNAGIRLEPVTERGQYVKYVGLLLME